MTVENTESYWALMKTHAVTVIGIAWVLSYNCKIILDQSSTRFIKLAHRFGWAIMAPNDCYKDLELESTDIQQTRGKACCVILRMETWPVCWPGVLAQKLSSGNIKFGSRWRSLQKSHRTECRCAAQEQDKTRNTEPKAEKRSYYRSAPHKDMTNTSKLDKRWCVVRRSDQIPGVWDYTDPDYVPPG
ncbi:hypothetical protein V8F33_005177 [Rhypophila sp. PSN 637]